MNRPPGITSKEFLAKLQILRTILDSQGYNAIYLQSEGALRWLTGMHHQVIDISPDSETTVQAIVSIKKQQPEIFLLSMPWEKARVIDVIKTGIWNETKIHVTYVDAMPNNSLLMLTPDNPQYTEIERAVVSPLAEGVNGNQFAKLTWLIGESRKALLDCSQLLKKGMNGWEVRNLLFSIYHKRGIELNLVMVGLSGMEKHLHPVYNASSFVEDGCMVKLVVGARYGEMFHSASQLVKFAAEPTEFEKRVHFGLQDTALGYADAFREGQTEGELYNALAEVFKTAAEKHGLPGFEDSAYLHHPGGPLSPLGNREFIISKDGKRKIIPYAQFAVNPVDCLAFLKFELQGMVQPHSQPLIFDEFSQVIRDKNCFDIREFYGRQLKLPTILSCSGFSESGK